MQCCQCGIRLSHSKTRRLHHPRLRRLLLPIINSRSKRLAPSPLDYPAPPDQLPNHTAPTDATDATCGTHDFPRGTTTAPGCATPATSRIAGRTSVTVVKAGVMALACAVKGVADQAGAADAALCDPALEASGGCGQSVVVVFRDDGAHCAGLP
jgi:hypothetical protein